MVVKQLYVWRIGSKLMKRNERIDRVELMRTFIRIVESGSLSAAARQMETTQATISRRLQSLEEMLGAKLLLRSTHAMKLTDDGERCYQHARQVVESWLALEDALQLTDEQPVGTLRVPSLSLSRRLVNRLGVPSSRWLGTRYRPMPADPSEPPSGRASNTMASPSMLEQNHFSPLMRTRPSPMSRATQ